MSDFGPKVQAAIDEFKATLAAQDARIAELERVAVRRALDSVGRSAPEEWSETFPVDLLPLDEDGELIPPYTLPNQIPVMFIQTRRFGRFREVAAVWPFTRNPLNPLAAGFYHVEHMKRDQPGDGWAENEESLAYRIGPETGHLFGITDVTDRYEFGGTVEPFADPEDFSPIVPDLPELPPDTRDGDIVGWWPVMVAGRPYRVLSLFWWKGSFYLGIWGSAPNAQWIEVRDGKLIQQGHDVTANYQFGVPLSESDFPS